MLKQCNDLESNMVVGQFQSTAMNLLRASGTDYSESRQAMRWKVDRES